MTDERMNATFAMLVANKPIDPSKVDIRKPTPCSLSRI